MNKFQILGIALIALLFGSCTTIQKTASTADINAYVVQYPTIADLEVAPNKVKKEVQWSPIFSTTSLETRKSNLTAELLESVDADVLVEPQYIHHKSCLNINKLTVSGFPAKYKNFRKATKEDLEALKNGCHNMQIVSEPCCGKVKAKKEKKAKRFFGLL